MSSLHVKFLRVLDPGPNLKPPVPWSASVHLLPVLSSCVEATLWLETLLGHVSHLEVDSDAEDTQGHCGNLVHLLGALVNAKPASNHVHISSGFNLK